MKQQKTANTERGLSAPLLVTPSVMHSEPQQEWACPQCTLLNPVNTRFCKACNYKNNPLPQIAVPPPNQDIDEMYTHPDLPSGSVAAPTGEPQQNVTPIVVYQDESGFKEQMSGGVSVAKKVQRRRRRRVRMVFGAAGGLIVGAIVFCGPVGVLLGGVGGAWAVREVSKRQERKKDIRVAEYSQVTQSHLSQAVVS